jgi:polyisoprenoid-binding protein YceI
MNSMRTAILSLGLTLAGSAAAVAAPTTFIPNADHTFVRFSYDHLGFSTQQSRFDKITGTVTLDAAAKTGSVDIAIDTKSVDTGSELFNGHIQGADFLDTAQYPTATFRSNSVKFEGVTKPITLTVTSFKHAPNMMKKDSIGANATGTIKRSEFNMSKYSPMVSEEVTLTIAIEAAVP